MAAKFDEVLAEPGHVVVASSSRFAMLAGEHMKTSLRYPAEPGRWIQNNEVLDADLAGVLELAEHKNLFVQEIQGTGCISEADPLVSVDLPIAVLDPQTTSLPDFFDRPLAPGKSIVFEEMFFRPLLEFASVVAGQCITLEDPLEIDGVDKGKIPRNHCSPSVYIVAIKVIAQNIEESGVHKQSHRSSRATDIDQN